MKSLTGTYPKASLRSSPFLLQPGLDQSPGSGQSRPLHWFCASRSSLRPSTPRDGWPGEWSRQGLRRCTIGSDTGVGAQTSSAMAQSRSYFSPSRSICSSGDRQEGNSHVAADQVGQVGGCDSDRVENARVRELTFLAKLVHAGIANLQ